MELHVPEHVGAARGRQQDQLFQRGHAYRWPCFDSRLVDFQFSQIWALEGDARNVISRYLVVVTFILVVECCVTFDGDFPDVSVEETIRDSSNHIHAYN